MSNPRVLTKSSSLAINFKPKSNRQKQFILKESLNFCEYRDDFDEPNNIYIKYTLGILFHISFILSCLFYIPVKYVK